MLKKGTQVAQQVPLKDPGFKKGNSVWWKAVDDVFLPKKENKSYSFPRESGGEGAV